jgi:hypothetical protein
MHFSAEFLLTRSQSSAMHKIAQEKQLGSESN